MEGEKERILEIVNEFFGDRLS
jgi:hypothetical protein